MQIVRRQRRDRKIIVKNKNHPNGPLGPGDSRKGTGRGRIREGRLPWRGGFIASGLW